jgi:PAS domain S-box-containing protein
MAMPTRCFTIRRPHLTPLSATRAAQRRRAVDNAAHLYRDIVEHCAWGMFQTTADGRYLMANPTLARIYGYDSADQLLSRLTDIGGQLYIDPTRRDAFVRTMGATGKVTGFESEVRRRDGAAIWISETCREVRNSTGHLLYYEGTVEDITARKAAEAGLLRAHGAAEAATEALQRANHDLERCVAERTAELRAMQEQMIHRERLSTLGRLTATVAHELRNPLSAIRNSLHSLRILAGPSHAMFDRQLSRMDRSIERCESFIADLTDFAHAQQLETSAIRLDEWIGEFAAAAVMATGVVLETHLGAGNALNLIDKSRLKRALDNILDNAAEALAEMAPAAASTRRVTITTTAAPGVASAAATAHPMVRLVIADNGPGIAPDILQKVFDPLFSTKSFGSGLGLPTARQIVELHGGTIAIDSAPGRGTRVEIVLPCAEAAQSVAA